MGLCLSDTNNYKKGSRTNNEMYDAQPKDTALLSPNDFPQLEIHTFLTKLKLKRCSSYRLLGIRIEFAGFEQFQLKSKILVNETARWDVQHLLDFKVSEYEMRKKFLVLSVIEEPTKIIGTLKINLYHLATGPYHQDFSVPLPKAPGARLSFNLKIYLKVNEIKVISKEREFPGDTFAFNIRSIIGDRIEETSLSYRYQVGVVKFKRTHSFQRNGSYQNVSNALKLKQSNIDNHHITIQDKKQQDKIPKMVKLASQQRPDIGYRELMWSQAVSKQMPSLKAYFPIYDLHCASFNIIFYYFTPQGRQFSSQCYISLLKLSSFACIQRKDPITSISWEDRNIDIQVKTFDHGRQSGKAIFNLSFSMQKFIKQMQICVRTQKGIQQSSPVFGQFVSSLNVPQQLKQLQQLSNEIQNLFIEVNRVDYNRERGSRNPMQEVNKRLKRQRQIIMNTQKQSKLMFVYQDQKALLKGQRELIELGCKTKRLLAQNRQQITPNCWQLLIALIKRGELSLAFIGFNKTQVQQYLNGKASQFVKRKKDVCLAYHRLMIDLLHMTFEALQTYNCENQKLFAELFCAYAYFRIPRFRNQVLGAITRPEDPQIQQWRGTEFNLNEQSTEIPVEGQNIFTIMFDWQNHFYRVLGTEQQFIKTQNKLSELFKDNDWESRMKKRGGAFFAFVRYWVNYVETIAINSKHILWRYFPGYNKILLSFLAEMKSKKIQDYSQSMRQAASSLLSNEKLLNPFVLIIFRKTNLNDRIQVFRTFDLLHIFFTSITNRGRSIPSTFDLKLLIKGIKSVLQGDCAFSMGKVLLLLYNHFKIFPVEFRIQISIFLMTKTFFKLFLHWSLNVRSIFHHLLFIRIYHEASKPIDQLDAKDQQIYRSNPEYRSEIISRYRKLIIILQNTQEFSHKIRKVKIDVYEKETYKKIKKKINQKRRLTYNPQLDSTKSIKQKFKSEKQYQYQLMSELAEPKLERYNSQVLGRNLQIAVENKKIVKKEEVIIKTSRSNKAEAKVIPRRKLSFFQNSLESQLVAFKEDQIIYIRASLEQYHRMNQFFIKYVQKNKDSVPLVKLELPLDEKELRPEGLAESDEW